MNELTLGLILGAIIGVVATFFYIKIARVGVLEITEEESKDTYRFIFREVAKIKEYSYAFLKIRVK